MLRIKKIENTIPPSVKILQYRWEKKYIRTIAMFYYCPVIKGKCYQLAPLSFTTRENTFPFAYVPDSGNCGGSLSDI